MAAKKTSQTSTKKTRKAKPENAKISEKMANSRVKRLLRWSFWFTVKMSVLLMFMLFIYSIS